MSILLVDDQPLMISLVQRMLRKLGFDRVEVARDGTMALAMLRQKDFGLVISDLMMQPLGGLELLAIIRADPKLQYLPFLVMTADTAVGSVTAALGAGMNGYLVKPFTMAALGRKMEEVCPSWSQAWLD
jgi:two-component system chemotaxis response regulator CheY